MREARWRTKMLLLPPPPPKARESRMILPEGRFGVAALPRGQKELAGEEAASCDLTEGQSG
jgi:hypothetical protein